MLAFSWLLLNILLPLFTAYHAGGGGGGFGPFLWNPRSNIDAYILDPMKLEWADYTAVQA